MVKNGHGLLGHGTLKSISQDWIDKMSWFFACWCKFRKARRYFNSYWVDIVKNGWDLLDHGTLKLGVSQMIWWIEQIKGYLCYKTILCHKAVLDV